MVSDVSPRRRLSFVFSIYYFHLNIYFMQQAFFSRWGFTLEFKKSFIDCILTCPREGWGERERDRNKMLFYRQLCAASGARSCWAKGGWGLGGGQDQGEVITAPPQRHSPGAAWRVVLRGRAGRGRRPVGPGTSWRSLLGLTNSVLTASDCKRLFLAVPCPWHFSHIFTRHVLWRVTGGAPHFQPPDKLQWEGPFACLPLLIQITEQMFSSVGIALEVAFGKINGRFTHFKGQSYLSFIIAFFS